MTTGTSELRTLRARGVGALTAASPARSERGRVCARPGCDTLLSVYNQASVCWLHEPRRHFALFPGGRRPAAPSTEVDLAL